MKILVEAVILITLVGWGVLRGIETGLQYWIERSIRNFQY